MANGLLHRVFRGVYLVGHTVPAPGALELAAVFIDGHATADNHLQANGRPETQQARRRAVAPAHLPA